MRRCFPIAVLLAAAGASAQTMVDRAKLPPALRSFEPVPGEQLVRCEVTPIRPMLDFGFRFQAGYVVRVPLDQYPGPGHRWAMLTRITPDGAGQRPAYLVNTVKLPDIPRTKASGDFGGGYLLGEGRYHVEWLLVDETARVCRKGWQIDAKLSRRERKVKVAMAPETVGELSLRGLLEPRKQADDARPIRLTVLLHAAPLSLRRTSLLTRDRVMLLGVLASLLERIPSRSVRLVVFSLEQQKEIFRRENFGNAAWDQVAEALNGLELNLVDYRVLQNRRGHVDLLADLVNQEMAAREPSDAVVFLGPTARYSDKVPPAALEKPSGATPQFFYFQLKPFFRRRSAALPDTITLAMTKLKGKTSIVYSPLEFDKAIGQLQSRLQKED